MMSPEGNAHTHEPPTDGDDPENGNIEEDKYRIDPGVLRRMLGLLQDLDGSGKWPISIYSRDRRRKQT